MISDSEKLKANEYLERKKLRLQQVREQSKNIAKNVRNRFQDEKNKQLRVFTEKKKTEFQSSKRQTMDSLQKDLASCLCEVGTSHNAAVDEITAEEEWKVQKEFNSQKASIRGSSATVTLQKAKAQQEQEARSAADRRKKGRLISNKIKSNVKQKSPSSAKSQPTERKIQHYYLENEDPDNECSNLTENLELGEVPHLNMQDRHVGSLENLNDEKSKSSASNRHKQTLTAVSPKKFRTRFVEPESRLSHEEDFNLHADQENATELSQDAFKKQSTMRFNPAMQACGFGGRSDAGDRDVYLGKGNTILEDPSMYRVNAVETLRQLSYENRLLQESEFDPTSYANSLHGYDSSAHDVAPATQFRRLDQISCDNPLNIIRQHIQNRNTDGNSGSVYSKAAFETKAHSNPCEYAALRDTINHARQTPFVDSTDAAPTIPSLPEYYMRSKTDSVQKDVERNSNIKKSPDLVPVDGHRIPKSRENRSADVIKRKPLKGILAKCGGPSRSVKYVTCNRLFGRQTPSKSDSTRDSARTVRCYDQPNKFAKNITFDSKLLVERTPRGSVDAYRRAKEENLEEERLMADMKICKNVTASRLRGEKALEKMKLENELVKMKKEIERLKNNERMSRVCLPETIYIEECPRECESRQHKIVKEFIEDERPIDVKSGKEANEKLISRSPGKKKVAESPPIKRVSASKSPSRSTVSRKTLTDDLDKIPTKESKDSSGSTTTLEPMLRITPDEVRSLDAEELFKLVQKQKKKLIKEVSMIGLPIKNHTGSHSPKKVLPKSDVVILKEDSSCWTSDEMPMKTTNKRFTKHFVAASPKEKSRRDKRERETNKTVVDQEKSNKEKPQVASSTTSSVSFQGLQIVIEIKKDNKKVEQTVTSIEDKENRLNAEGFINSSNELSRKTSKFVSKKTVTVENENTSSVFQYDTSESTTYMSPPERITTHFEKLLDRKLASQSSGLHSQGSFQPVDVHKKNAIGGMRNGNERRYRDSPTSPDSVERLNRDRCASQITRSEVSTYTRQDNVTSVQNKGVQVQITTQANSAALQVERKSVGKISNLDSDPMLKKYIRQLLEMSKNGVNNLEVDVSDVTTPGSSIVNVTSNLAGDQSQNTFHDKIEKLQNFIHENYSLLEELGKDKVFSSSSNAGSVKIRDILRASSDDIRSSIAASSVENNQKLKSNINVGQVLPQESKRQPAVNKVPNAAVSRNEPILKPCKITSGKLNTPPFIHQASSTNVRQDIDVRDNISQQKSIATVVPSQMSSINTNNNDFFVDQTDARKEVSIFETNEIGSSGSLSHRSEITDAQYDRLTEECSQRISSLSEMLHKVRKEKEAILSWSASPNSEEDASKLSHKKTPSESNAGEKESIPAEEFVPMLSDIPKPKSVEVTRDSQIDQLRHEILSISEGMDTFTPMVWDYKPIPSGIKSSQKLMANNEQFILLDSFDDSRSQHQNDRPKPPVALVRNPIMRNNNVDTGTPHELSTIAEVDTPITGRNASGFSKNMELSLSIVSGIPTEINTPSSKNGYDIKHLNFENVGLVVSDADVPNMATSGHIAADDQTLVNISIPGSGNRVHVDVEFQPFASLHEYLKQKYPDDMNVEITLEESSDETLPDIIPEMLKRNLIKKPFSSRNSTTHGSAEDSSSSSKSESALLALSPLKDSRRQRRHHEKNDPSISGVEAILSSSSSSDRSSELEAALKVAGIGWAATLLKRTGQAFELSSTSSSARNESAAAPSRKHKTPTNEPGDLSTGSVGLSTLLDDLNISDDLFFKKYSTSNISRPSIDEGLEMLLRKIENVKCPPNKDHKRLNPSADESNVKKATAGEGIHLAKSKLDTTAKPDDIGSGQGGKDKTHQRTSTPVLPSISPSFSSSGAGSSQHGSKFLFGMESDLSSVKNVSNSDRNLSSDEKYSLSVPNISLKFGKLFLDSTTMSDK